MSNGTERVQEEPVLTLAILQSGITQGKEDGLTEGPISHRERRIRVPRGSRAVSHNFPLIIFGLYTPSGCSKGSFCCKGMLPWDSAPP